MDASEAAELRRELLALRARVERLEARLEARLAHGEHEGAFFQPAASRTGEPERLSFVQPAKPSLESRIGSQLFNRVGILALLVGVAWFLKYAVDRDWLGPAARVLVGFAGGLGLIGWSEQFRRRGYSVFSFSLKAAGVGVLYLSLWASFSLFHLVSYPVAFAGMALVTAGSAWMCAAQRSEALAGVAVVGGFLTPALLGQPASFWVLGTYLALLNAGLIALLLGRQWPRLLPAAVAGTEAYLLVRAAGAISADSASELCFSLLFVAVFTVTSGVVAGWEHGRARAIGAGVTIAVAVAGIVELWRFVPPFSGLARWEPLLSAVWFALLLAASRSATRLVGARLAGVHAALVIAFVALGIGTVCAGGGVVLGWGLEAAALLLLSSRLRNAPAAVRAPFAGALLLFLAGAWLVTLSIGGSLRVEPRVILNARCALFAFLVVLGAWTVRLAALRDAAGDRQWARIAGSASLFAAVLALLAGVFEVHDYWAGSVGAAERFWDSAWAAALAMGLLLLGFLVRWGWLRWQGLGLLCLAGIKVFLYDTRELSQGFRILSFLGLGVLLLLVSFIYQRDLLHLRGEEHGG